MIKVSVIVPIYNAEKYLERTIGSLLSQTIDNYEILLINDGSTDGSKEIIKYYEENYDKVISFSKENGGQSSARNYGISKAKGKYLAFIDADDYIDNSFLEKMYNKAIQNDADICFCNYYHVYEDKIEKDREYQVKDLNNVTKKEYLLADPSPCNKIYKKDFLDKNNFKFEEGRIYEDLSHIFSLVKYNPKISYLNEYLFYYVHSSESTMRKSKYTKKYEDIFGAVEYLNKKLSIIDCTDEVEYIITYHLLYLAALNFYKYNKLDMIDKISDFMKKNYNKFYKNKYYKKLSLREKTLCYLFYKKQYKIVRIFQKLKGSI